MARPSVLFRWLPPRPADRQRLVLFDGVCALCHWSVRFLVARDRSRLLRYAPLQGKAAGAEPAVARFLEAAGGKLESLLYLRRQGRDLELLARSDAILAILDELGGPWRLLALTRVVPRPIRDWLYDLVGRHRYRWFGRYEACRLPRTGEAELFFD